MLTVRVCCSIFASFVLVSVIHSPQSSSQEVNLVPIAGPHYASYFTSNEFELLYAEQMVPSEGDRRDIFWASCEYSFGPRLGYAGIQHQRNKWHKGVKFEHNNICSIWDLEDKTGTNLPPEVELTYKARGVHSQPFRGEGTGIQTSHPMPWSPTQWYATVIRRWYIPGENATRAAMFMYSYTEKKWTMYVSFKIPGANLPLTGNTCAAFLERYGGYERNYQGVYGQHFRMHKDGSWEKPLYYMASAIGNPASWKPELYQGVNIKLTAGGKFDNQKNEHIFHPNQTDMKPKPTMMTPVVTKVKSRYDKELRAIHVEWEIAKDRPPQLSHRIKVYNDNPFLSDPVATNSDIVPEKRSTFFEASLEPGTYWISVEFTDIFNQMSNLGNTSFVVY